MRFLFAKPIEARTFARVQRQKVNLFFDFAVRPAYLSGSMSLVCTTSRRSCGAACRLNHHRLEKEDARYDCAPSAPRTP